MNPGDTFLIPDFVGTHLNFVLSVLPDGSLILAHFTSRRAYSDDTCIVNAGEHSFIKHPTVVRYDQASICPADRVGSLERVIIRRLEPLSEDLLRRVQQGAIDSPQTPDHIKNLLRNMNR